MPFLFQTTYLFVSVVHVPFGIFSPRRPRRHVLEWSLKIQAQFLLCSTRTCTLLYPFTRSLIIICPTDSLTSLYAFKWTPHMSPLFDKGEKKRFTSRSFSSAVALKFCSVSSVSRCVTSISYGHTNPDAPFPWFASSKSYSRRLSGSPSSLYAAWAGNQARRTLKESNRRGLAIMLVETTCLTDSHLWPTGPNCSFQMCPSKHGSTQARYIVLILRIGAQRCLLKNQFPSNAYFRQRKLAIRTRVPTNRQSDFEKRPHLEKVRAHRQFD